MNATDEKVTQGGLAAYAEKLPGANRYVQLQGVLQFICDTSGDVFVADGAVTYNYNVDGTINYTEMTDPVSGAVYRRTNTYNGSGQLTAETGWVKQ